MRKLLVSVTVFLMIGCVSAQKADNALQGYYEEQGNETFYKGFSFDGNGKVVGGVANGYYYLILGLQDKALETWTEGEKHGDAASELSKAFMDLGKDMDQSEKLNKKNSKKKK